MHKIPGKALLGFGDFFSEFDHTSVGAKKSTPAPSSSSSGSSAGGLTPPASHVRQHPPVPKTTVVATHGHVLKQGKVVATKVAGTIGKVMQQLNKTAKQPPAVRLPSGKVAVGRAIHIGAAAASTLTPQAQAAIAKYNASGAKAAAATKNLAKHAVKLKKHITKLAKSIVQQKNIAKQTRTPGMKTVQLRTQVGALLEDPRVHSLLENPETSEETAELLGRMIQSIGDATTAAPATAGTGPDVNGNMPGDPNYDPTTDPTSSSYNATSSTSLADNTDDPADDPTTWPPPPPPSEYMATMPPGSIPYDGSKGTPSGYALSYYLFTRETDRAETVGGFQDHAHTAGIDTTNHHGYVWGQYHDSGPEKGVPFGDFKNKTGWNRIWGRYHLGIGQWHKPVQLADVLAATPNEAVSSNIVGPIIGNPNIGFGGMRMDSQGNMFWLPQEAPDWLTFPIKQAAAQTAAAAAAAQKAADAANAAALQQQQAQEQLAQDAANAQAALAASAQQTQQGQAEADASTALVQQSQAQTAQQAVDTQQEKQTTDILAQQAQQLLDYQKAHPDQFYGPQAQDGGQADDGSQDDGSSDGSQDDGSSDDSQDDGSSDDLQDDGSPSDEDELNSNVGGEILKDAFGEGDYYSDEEGDL